MNSFLPSFETFEKNFRDGKSQLVWTWVSADLETPVSAFLKLTGDEQNSFLLESVEGGATLGRYSAIGLEPDLVWTYSRNTEKDPLKTLRALVTQSRIDIVAPEIPPMGPSGLFGYMGYDMVRLIENIPDKNPDELGIPDSIMIRPTVMVIFDNVQSRMCLVTPVRETTGNAREKYDFAIRTLEKTIGRLANQIPATISHPAMSSPSHSTSSHSHSTSSPRRRGSIDPLAQNSTSLSDDPWIPACAGMTPLEVTSNITRQTFFSMVEKAVEYIRAGEIFQVVLGQRFSMPFTLPGFSLYRSLRRLNPSPFLFYFNFGGFQLVGSSPEILVRVRDRIVTIRPIAGTRRRGKNAAEDAALAEELLSDPKERAEHLMLLDLGRNDVGRVAKTGTVKVTDRFIVERYSHVMHIVSNVEGELRDDLDSFDALFAGFPAGTVSGAPKVRAMEIIDELENTRRGYYGGCVGYMDGHGDLDTCIALRTALVKDGKVHVQAGAGIVADSNPEAEYQECVNKAKAIVQAAEESPQT